MQDLERFKRLLGYANPYALSSPVVEPVAVPQQFLDTDPRGRQWLFEQRNVRLDPAEISAALRRDTAPIPAASNREGYNGDDHFTFWLSGFVTYKQLTSIADRFDVSSGAFLDFGGSTGRVFRHFHYQNENWRVISCDFKMTSVEWNLKWYPSGIEVFQNTYNAFLPIESNSISLISAMSVFTHIDESETSWLMELRRILRPGGLLLATVHDENTWRADTKLRDNAIKINPGWTHDDLPEGRRVSTWRVDDPYRCNVFATQSYIRQQWGRYLDVVEILPCSFGPQTMVVLRKRG
jgi:SAM-dependent methyltransferase